METRRPFGAAWFGTVGVGVVLLGAVCQMACGDEAAVETDSPIDIDPAALAASVTIYRDAWGVPHIDGPTDESVSFGSAYAQAEDYFWQIEDTYLLALGRYAEAYGMKGLKRDFLNRAFEVVPSSKRDFPALDPKVQSVAAAYVEGLNWYLARHPEVKPRLIRRFEPWHMLAYARHLTLEMGYRYTRVAGGTQLPGSYDSIHARRGSNAWAIAPERTKSGNAMLFINPHMPWFGFGQFYECHLRSGEGWSMTGGAFFGNPIPNLGHNEHLGWAFTVNEPDIADAWIETFDHPDDPLKYRYGDGYRDAEEFQASIRVRLPRGVRTRRYTFRKTHHGPIVKKLDSEQYLSVRIAKLYDSVLMGQLFQMVRARNLDDFRSALDMQNFQFMNTIYADRHGDIYYLYNGLIPERDTAFDWSQPVDGSDPRTEWGDFHPVNELPQVVNPASGYVQNCNSSPFTTTDEGSPAIGDFPAYMAEDAHDDKRRAKLSRRILREVDELTFEELETLAYDTTLYWPLTEAANWRQEFETLEEANPLVARRAEPYLEHLLDWDFRASVECTRTLLCVTWYQELYGSGYPAETLLPRYVDNLSQKYRALVRSASRLDRVFGDWKVAWGEASRIQRHANWADFTDVRDFRFDDDIPSLPNAGVPSPLGVVFVTFYTPSIQIPLIKNVKRHYGVLGSTYVSVIEFGDRIRAATATQFGQSSDPSSPHFMDQAKLTSERRLKPELFYWDDVVEGAVRVYKPGEEASSTPVIAADR